MDKHLLNSSSSIANSMIALPCVDLAFKALVQNRPRTGALHRATLPANLSGIEVSVVRLRSMTLWNRGANFSYFRIPSRSLPVPHVRRLVIVYQDLGNWSSYYYNVPGYSLTTCVIGFMFYDASNLSSRSVTQLDIDTLDKGISIHFPNFSLPKGARCATFSANGTVNLSDTSSPNACYSRIKGHFAIVAPLERKQRRVWDLWVIGFVLGFVGLILVSVAGAVLVKLLKAKKIHEMERQADKGVVLETIWIGRVKMPSATVTRTHPVLENGCLS
ncbi:hypothetical protein F0562_011579 [Nyssa sinensis]|uniref:Uncharacterized protein n=1 Tax=Nyssa sinensis TaxID=561372 RepID=A0A5J4ZSY1_9ASTE|nr:hypothetical protein F0562_011579 [Nyssa sinensis]